MPEFQKRELASDVPLGKQLKDVRRNAKLGINEVATVTKIQPKFIKALEDGRYEDFPADVYARGFLENYAHFLGFPVDEVIRQYKRERGISGSQVAVNPLPPTKHRELPFTITPRTLWFAGAALSLFIAASYLLTQVFGLVAAAPKLELLAPAQNATAAVDLISVEGNTDPGAELAINGQPVPTDPNGGFKEEVHLLPGANVLRVSAKNKTGKEKVVSRSVVLALAATPTPVPAVAPAGMLLTLKVGPNSAYVTVVVDGKTVLQGLLVPNTTQTFSVLSRALVSTTNGGSTHVLINGVDQGTLGSEGQKRTGKEYLVPTPSPAPTPAK